jgi:hypothetical protein
MHVIARATAREFIKILHGFYHFFRRLTAERGKFFARPRWNKSHIKLHESEHRTQTDY